MTLSPEFTATVHVRRAHEEMRSRPTGIELEVLSGADEGKTFRFALGDADRRTDRLLGGRHLCDIELTDGSISQRHFELGFEGGGVRLRDLGSRNGVWIGRARIEEAWLAPGTEFFAGECRIRVAGIHMEDVPVSTHTTLGTMTGASEATRALFSMIERVAPTPMTVLVMGESGTGKGEVARTIHLASGREGPFQVLDCSTLPRELAASLVLGHAKGAFSGAARDRAGPFEQARGGTIFLDEIGELPLDVQQGLLTVVDRRELQRIGETKTRKVDVRIVAATNRNLAEEVAAGRFRHDLYYRLRQFVLTVAPLRDRPDDVEFLAQRFLEEFGREAGREHVLADESKAQLKRLKWDGNVRQLRDVMRRAAYLAPGPVVSRADLQLYDEELEDAPDAEASGGGAWVHPRGLRRAVAEYTIQLCERLMAEADGELGRAAKLAQYSTPGLRALLVKHGLSHLMK